MNDTTRTLVHLVRAPRGRIVHVSIRGELTVCHRMVADTWSSELLEPAGAQDATTCDACRAGMDLMLMRVRQLEQLPVDEPVDEPAAELPVDRTPLTLLVVPCSGKKLDHAAPAAELYQGTLTTMGLAAASVVVGTPGTLAGHVGVRTVILSALHGLLELDTVVEPYDVRMGDSSSITTQQLADQLRATGATQVVALTPNTYTDALAAACELAGVALVTPLAGCRGIGEQRGRLAQLRRSGGIRVLPLESRGVARDHALALEQYAAHLAAQQPATRISTDAELTERLLAGGASPERAAMVVAARNQLQRELTAAAPAIAAALEDEPAGQRAWMDALAAQTDEQAAAEGWVAEPACWCDSSILSEHLESCPAGQLERQQLERDHAAALDEDAAHDAAAAAAAPLDAYLETVAAHAGQLPARLRRQARSSGVLRLVPPGMVTA